ncbi:heterokaryon incompatibility protein-domain-containing protein [Nemania abortiva]|nr:heterokaryon incompatibility protein-domain-containing protein [Nemania abortiva]
MTFIRECLDTCAREHSVCQQDASHPPKRLIDIRDLGNGRIKVVKTSVDFREPYVALSYCWGQGVSLRTTKANILDMMTSIKSTSLPSVILDAIKITAVLDFKYIWVDSLCIVQDDAQDWEEESARMCSIYEGACLTIAMSSTESANVSLTERYKRHEPTVFRCHQIGNPIDRQETSTIFHLASREECEYGFHNEDAVRRPDREPLHDRGWTLQEAILSTRVIFYTPKELQWQCQTVQTCQCQIPPPTKPGVVATKAHMRGDLGKSRQPHEIFAAWDLIVETYSERLLTNPDDKLPALSGLAQLVRRYIATALRLHCSDSTDETPSSRRLEYVAGLWADDLVRGMLWGPLHMTVNLPYSPSQTTTTNIILGAHVRNDTPARVESSTYYRAPSFSWASVDGPITYRSRDRNLSKNDPSYIETARIIDVWSRPAGGDPFGRLAAAEDPKYERRSRTGVVIRAPLIEDCALIGNSSGSMHNSRWTLREIEPRWDTMWLDTEFVEPFPVVEEPAPGTKLVERDYRGGEGRGELKGQVPRWSVRRTHRKDFRSAEDIKETIMDGVSLLMMAQTAEVQYFLLLGISPSDAGAYERLGTVSTSRVSGGGDLVKLSNENIPHTKGAELLEGVMEWRGKGGVVSRMRMVTLV